MSRSGYSDDCTGWDLVRWRGAVKSAIRGKRGQAFLQEMLDALESMPERELYGDVLVKDGCMCAMGAVASSRGIEIDPKLDYDASDAAEILNIPRALAAEIAFENDGDFYYREEDPRGRWIRMYQWIKSQIESKA